MRNKIDFPIHVIVYLERDCTCGKTLLAEVQDLGEVGSYFDLEDAITEHNVPIAEIECPNCGSREYPRFITLYNKTAEGRLLRVELGTKDIPVVSPGDQLLPYSNIVTPEEAARQDRGSEKYEQHFREQEDEIWDSFFQFALSKWEHILRDITLPEFVQAYRELGLSAPSHLSASGYRRDVLAKLKDETDKKAFWRAANSYLVYNYFLWLDPFHWHVKDWIATYGRERIAWLVLNFPVPEELEEVRTARISELATKRSGEHGILWERIGQLGRQLDKYRRRAETLAAEVQKLRLENQELRRRLKELESQVKTEYVVRDPADVAKIRSLKGLIKELRDEVARLRSLVPAGAITEPVDDHDHDTEDRAADINKEDEAVYPPPGTCIAVFGAVQPNQEINGCLLKYHEGTKVDADAERLAREAHVLVLITRSASHEVMWWLKEIAIDLDKPALFVKFRNASLLLQEVGRFLARTQ